MAAPALALHVSSLYKEFPPAVSSGSPFIAVDHIDFSIAQGEVVGLLGPNGAGKTTTIQMLLGTLTPTSGRIEYFGTNFFKHRSSCLERIGFASTYINFPSSLTVQENLRIYGMLYGLKGQDLTNRIKHFLAQFGIDQLAHIKTGDISAGQKTRVMLCKAFLADPALVLLDEPTASLDPDIAQQIRLFVRQQQLERGIGVLFTSHNMAEVAQVCARVLVMTNGTIIANDSPENLAASVGGCVVQLTFTHNAPTAAQFLHTHGYQINQHEQVIAISVQREQIGRLLTALAQEHINYVDIHIQQPTLEDYFLHISGAQKTNKGSV